MINRIEKLKTAIFEKDPWICPERARNLTASWKKSEGEPINIRRALAFKEILENQTIYINEGELIVGNQASGLLGTPVFPEYGVEWMIKEFSTLPERKLDRYDITADTLEELMGLFKYWKGKTHFDKVKAESLHVFPVNLLPAWDPDHGSFDDVVSNSGRMATGNGHVIINYEKVLNIGLRGIIKDAEKGVEKCDCDVTDPEAGRKKIFLKSIIISLESAIGFAHRYADFAEKRTESCKDIEKQKELKIIGANLRKVPEYPAETLWEALQSCWMVHLLLQIEANGHSMSFGRFDQYIYPFFKADIEEGRIIREDAQILTECFLVKCNEIKKIRQWSHTRKMHGFPLFQTLTIGGITTTGEDAANDFSYLVLDATAAVKMQEPTTVARIHPKSSPDFVLHCVKTLVKHGGGLPGLFNDEVGIQMLLKNGVSLEDARNWAVDGCSEPVVPGKHNTITSGTCHVNLLKVLDISLKDGFNTTTGYTLHKGNGKLSEMNSFQEIIDAYKSQLNFYIHIMPMLDTVTSRAHMELTPCPYLSALLDYRIEIGKDVEEGGGPNYNATLMIGHCSVNVGNSLYAIKKNVFDEKKITLKELEEALAENFQSEKGRLIRKILLETPKYGNDIDEVDFMVKDSLNWYLKGFDKYVPIRGGHYCPSPQTLSANAYTGELLGATPDGRAAGEPTADNISPAAGDDIDGATAVLKSVAKLDHVLATHGTILNMKLHPSTVSGGERLKKFADMIRAFFNLQGFQVQFNIVSAETLREAQKHPEHYRNLIVKVAGYSARFTTLDEHLQNQIIARTEYVK